MLDKCMLKNLKSYISFQLKWHSKFVNTINKVNITAINQI